MGEMRRIRRLVLEAMRYNRSEFDALLTSFPLNGDL